MWIIYSSTWQFGTVSLQKLNDNHMMMAHHTGLIAGFGDKCTGWYTDLSSIKILIMACMYDECQSAHL